MTDAIDSGMAPSEFQKAFSTVGVVLAGGRGSRMESHLPKSLHTILGKTMLEHILWILSGLFLERICIVLWEENYSQFLPVITSFQEQRESKKLQLPKIAIVLQKDPHGTAYAVGCASYLFEGAQSPGYCEGRLWHPDQNISPVDSLLICPGDAPALCLSTLKKLMIEHVQDQAHLSLIGCYYPHPHGYGRIIRAGSRPVQIVEEKDATDEQKSLNLCYSGVMMVRLPQLFSWLSDVEPNAITGEYYLTDIMAMAYRTSPHRTHLLVTDQPNRFLGVNSEEQKKTLENLMKIHRLNKET